MHRSRGNMDQFGKRGQNLPHRRGSAHHSRGQGRGTHQNTSFAGGTQGNQGRVHHQGHSQRRGNQGRGGSDGSRGQGGSSGDQTRGGYHGSRGQSGNSGDQARGYYSGSREQGSSQEPHNQGDRQENTYKQNFRVRGRGRGYKMQGYWHRKKSASSMSGSIENLMDFKRQESMSNLMKDDDEDDERESVASGASSALNEAALGYEGYGEDYSESGSDIAVMEDFKYENIDDDIDLGLVRSRALKKRSISTNSGLKGSVSVFWDIQNCPVPSNVSAYDIVKKVRDKFYGSLTEADFIVACDILNMKQSVTDELNSAQVTIIHVSSGKKNSADEKLRIRLRRFTDLHEDTDSLVVLISGDVDFLADLHEMRYRYLIKVVLIHNSFAKRELRDVANEAYLYDDFFGDLKKNNEIKPEAVSVNLKAQKSLQENQKSSENVSKKEPKKVSDAGKLQPPLAESSRKEAKVKIVIRNGLGDPLYWKDYLSKIIPVDFQIEKDRLSPCILYLLYPSVNKAKKATNALLKHCTESNSQDFSCLGIVSEEKDDQQQMEDNVPQDLNTVFQKKLQKSISLHDSKIKKLKDQLEGLRSKATTENQKLLKAYEEQLQMHEARLNEFLNASSNLKKNIVVAIKNSDADKLRKIRKCIEMESSFFLQDSFVYGMKTEILNALFEKRVLLLQSSPGSGKSLHLTEYLWLESIFNQTRLIINIQPTQLAAERSFKYASLTLEGKVACKLNPLQKVPEEAAVIYTTAKCFFHDMLYNKNLLKKVNYVICDEVQARTLHQDVVLGLLRDALEVHHHIRLVLCSSDDCSGIEKFFKLQEGDIIRQNFQFPVDVVWKGEEGDYISHAVDIALNVVKNRIPGNILVYLASYHDMFAAQYMFHNRLSQEKLKGVFTQCIHLDQTVLPTAKEATGFKVIFAVKVPDIDLFELHVMYVIDAGMIERAVYEKKARVRKTTYISKSTADFRKSTAGMSSPGTCFRLYTKNKYQSKDMPRASLLEVQSKNLENVFLKLLHCEKNICEVCPDSPNREALTEAQNSLEHLGLIKDLQLTKLGSKIFYCFLEPRQAKLVFQGIMDGIGFDALLIALLVYKNFTDIFLHPEKQNKRRQFTSENSDFANVTMLYKEWLDVPKKAKSLWCGVNGINEVVIRTFHAKFITTQNLLTPQDASQIKKMNVKDAPLKLSKLLLDCFPEFVFVASGRFGYSSEIFGDDQRLYHNSVISRQRQAPPVVLSTLFLESVNCSRLLLTNVCALDATKLNSPKLTLMMSMKNKGFAPVVVGPFGKVIWMKHIFQEGKLAAYTSALIEATEVKNTKIEIDAEKNSLVVYTLETFHDLASEFFRQIVLEEHKNLKKRDREVRISSDNFQGNSPRVVIGLGGGVQEILSPTMYRSIVLKNITIPIPEMKAKVNSFGDIVQYYVSSTKEGKKTIITYKKSSVAAKAYTELKKQEGMFVSVDKQYPKDDNEPESVFRFIARCSRRAPTGIAFVDIAEPVYRKISFSLPKKRAFEDSVVTVGPSQNVANQLYIRGLPGTITKEKLKKLFLEMFPVPLPFETTKLLRKTPFKSSKGTNEEFQSQLKKFCDTYTGLKNVFVDVKAPSDKDVFYMAVVFVKSLMDGANACEILNGTHFRLEGNTIPTELEPILMIRFALPQSVFSVIKTDIQEALKDCQDGYRKEDNIKLEVKKVHSDEGTEVVINFCANNVNDFQKCVHAFNSLLFSRQGSTKELLTTEDLFSENIDELLKALLLESNVYICKKVNRVQVIGNRNAVATAIGNFKKFVHLMEQSITQTMSFVLTDGSILKSATRKYGLTLHGLIDQCDIFAVKLDFSTCSINLKGNVTSVRKAEDLLRKVNKNSTVSAKRTKCPVCREPVSEQYHNLECCGHAYCVECLLIYLSNAVPPLKCIVRDCNTEWVIMDILKATGKNESLLQKFARKSLAVFLDQDRKKYCLCPTPGCEMVLKYKKNAKEELCPCCQNRICLHCESWYHYGMTCDKFQSSIANQPLTDSDWVAVDRSKRRLCRKCNYLIEKTTSVKVFACPRCRTFTCWNCNMEIANAADARHHIEIGACGNVLQGMMRKLNVLG